MSFGKRDMIAAGAAWIAGAVSYSALSGGDMTAALGVDNTAPGGWIKGAYDQVVTHGDSVPTSLKIKTAAVPLIVALATYQLMGGKGLPKIPGVGK